MGGFNAILSPILVFRHKTKQKPQIFTPFRLNTAITAILFRVFVFARWRLFRFSVRDTTEINTPLFASGQNLQTKTRL